MSVTVSTGPKSLLALGVSLGDIALLYSYGKKVGNFFRASKNEEELLESLMEDPEALLRRKGLIEPVRMESVYQRVDFIYQGSHITNASTPEIASKQGLSALSWLMVLLITALDFCLPPEGLQLLLIEAFSTLLGGDRDMEDALRVQLPTNIQSWRDVGGVRGIVKRVGSQLRKARGRLVEGDAVPQLNKAERKEALRFVVWLMEGKTHGIELVSATVFAVAKTLGNAGVHLITEGKRSYETQPLVSYKGSGVLLDYSGLLHHPSEHEDPFNLTRGVTTRAQLVSYPRGEPQSMIETLPVSRATRNRMSMLWHIGAKAAGPFTLTAFADMSFDAKSEVYYHLEGDDRETSRFRPELGILAGHAFPMLTQGVLAGVEEVVKGVGSHRIEWLSQHTALDFLQKTEASLPSRRPEDMEVWLLYQALVFGYYYSLLGSLVELTDVASDTESDTFFRGVWGYGSTTFLAACADFGQKLRGTDGVSRTHVIYLLSMMYSGRFKLYTAGSTPTGLLGVLGHISVLALPLMRTTDDPEQIARFAIVQLPIVDLAAENNGELYTGYGCYMSFKQPPAEPRAIIPRGTQSQWSLHAKMDSLFGEHRPGVVMAARCNGRLVGWFSPLAADVVFLSSAYQKPRYSSDPDHEDREELMGFEITDQNWQDGTAIRAIPAENPENVIGVVQSRGCPALRYAATAI